MMMSALIIINHSQTNLQSLPASGLKKVYITITAVYQFFITFMMTTILSF